MSLSNISIHVPVTLTYTQTNANTVTIVAGVAGWIDTDISSWAGTDTSKIWVFISWCNSLSQQQGVRDHGSILEPNTAVYNSATFLSKIDSTGHMDFYRSPNNSIGYTRVGYFKLE